MPHEVTFRPTLSINLKSNAILIHQGTFRAIGYPEYIVLIVDSENHTLILRRSDDSDIRAYCLSRKHHQKGKCIRLYSQSLVRHLFAMCDGWQAGHAYRIYGRIIPHEGQIQFSVRDSVMVCKKHPIRLHPTRKPRRRIVLKHSVKTPPAYDPDAETQSLALTIPSWIGSISRVHSVTDFSQISSHVRHNLKNELSSLKAIIETMMSAIKENTHE